MNGFLVIFLCPFICLLQNDKCSRSATISSPWALLCREPLPRFCFCLRMAIRTHVSGSLSWENQSRGPRAGPEAPHAQVTLRAQVAPQPRYPWAPPSLLYVPPHLNYRVCKVRAPHYVESWGRLFVSQFIFPTFDYKMPFKKF